VARLGRARIEFHQSVVRGDEVLASADLTLVCVDAGSHKPIGVPEAIRRKLEGLQ
jgi:acyl-CoA thioester hydrolase